MTRNHGHLAELFRAAFLSIVLMVSAAGMLSGPAGAAESKAQETPPVPVEVTRAAASEFIETIDVVGSLSAKHQADVRSEVAGIVREVLVTEWVRVSKGQVLARLDTREPQSILNRSGAAVEMARASLLQAQVGVQRAEREFRRIQHLRESGLATQQSLDEAGTEKEASIARRAAAEAQLKAAEYELEAAKTRFAKTTLIAPIDGIVALRGVNVGDLVGEAGSNKVLFRIVDNRLLDLTVTVPSRYVGAVRRGQPLTFTTNAFPEKTFTGSVMFLNPALTEPDRSLKVVAEVPNPDELLKSGMFVEGNIATGNRRSIIQIPRSSLMAWNMESRSAEIFVVENGIARKRKVSTAGISQDRVEIASGLSEGTVVVVRGGFNVKDGERVLLKSAD